MTDPSPVPAASTTTLGVESLSVAGASVSWRDLGAIGLVSIQLALALVVIYEFKLESRTFFQVMLIGAIGFGIHALLPLPYRMPFFVLLSLAAIVQVLGLRDGFCLCALGLVLIAICHLPSRMVIRVCLLLVIGTLFALWRMEFLPAPWSAKIWPILGSMFMFRLVLYLYALKHDEKAPSVARTLAYFFMFPNVCFPLYPVIDYSTFARTHYDREASEIYERGARWIVRGLLHLIAYRFVYLHLAGDPAELLTLGDVVRFLLATFLLYLRVSGQFHLIAGILHLFGFRLPETHHLYYLASSFTDFWRRINIYWKDFMMKLVYYPSYFSLRRRGGNVALIGATVMVFLSTWLLHSYQWFWLRGGFPVAAQDALFWGVLGALVVFGSLREANRPRHRTARRASAWSAWLALRTVITFTAICVLWSLWSAESPMAWVAMWIAAGNVGLGDIGLLIGLILAGLLVAGRAWSVREANDATASPFYRSSAAYSTAVLVGLVVAGHPSLYAWSGSRLTSTIASLQHSTLNAGDAALRQRGYYENLDNISRMSTQLWEIQAQRPKHWAGGLSATDAYHERRDFMRYDLKPDTKTVLLDQPLTVNQWGMRGRGYSLAKPAGTYRIAVLGPSHVMGSGVADGETFTDFLEAELNRTARAPNRRYEVLNFGVAGFSLLQQLAMLEDRVLAFQPDVVVVTDSPRLTAPVAAHVVHVVGDRVPIPFPGLEALVRQTGVPALADDGIPVPFENVRAVLGKLGVKSRMPWREADRRLRLAADGLVRWTLQRIADVTREHAAVPVFLALDLVLDEPVLEMRALRDASDAGYLVFNLLNCWVHRDRPLLRIATWDDHPNAAGNRVIAETLMAMMHQHRAELRLRTVAADIVVEQRR